METTPPMEGASEIKYSVKTTPYLQSVKKLIEDEVSTSRRKSNIKDLKFLTPVRRSSRIQRKSSQLPTMLVDHDPCVSSLAELVKLNDDANAYIYRKTLPFYTICQTRPACEELNLQMVQKQPMRIVGQRV
ncbi:hypothetical protein INR49_026216 [Caranx melampygus]|nr:hypothetical protein INR49_026216 [Caranx melampygus]